MHFSKFINDEEVVQALGDEVQRTFDSLTVMPVDDFLEYGFTYQIVCEAQSFNGRQYGRVSKFLNT